MGQERAFDNLPSLIQPSGVEGAGPQTKFDSGSNAYGFMALLAIRQPAIQSSRTVRSDSYTNDTNAGTAH